VKSGRHFALKEQRQTKSFTYVLENRDLSQLALSIQSIKFIQHFAKLQDIIRITQDGQPGMKQDIVVNQTQYSIDPETGALIEKVLNDLDAVEYDCEMIEDAYSVSAQEERYAKLGDLFNATAEISVEKANALLDIMVQEGGFPAAEKILDAWGKSGQPSPEAQQLQQLMMQIQQIMAKLGIVEKQTDIQGKVLDNQKKKNEIVAGIKNNILGTLQPKAGVKQKQVTA